MNHAELTTLLEPFGKKISDLTYHPDDYEWFKTDKSTNYECCPECGSEQEITQDGKSDCSECGHKEILPCACCPLSDISLCDWDEKTRCSAFPKEVVA